MTDALTSTTAPIVFMPALYNETLQLLMDAHDYFTAYGETDHKRFGDEAKTLYSYEMSRLTLRLSSVMAWILLRRAVHGGKLSHEEARQRDVLGSEEICLYNCPEAISLLPAQMAVLLDRSHSLYTRVCRLNETVH